MAAPHRAHLSGAPRAATRRADRRLDHAGTTAAGPGGGRRPHARVCRTDHGPLHGGRRATNRHRRRPTHAAELRGQLPLRDGRGLIVRRFIFTTTLCLASFCASHARADGFAAQVAPPRFEVKAKSGATLRQVLEGIGDAGRLIALGDADVMVAGGTELPVNRISLAGFAACRALSTGFNDTPKKASRPYDRDRDGFVMGEGAGAVVLEEYEHAKKRGARIYAELVGYGLSGDAYHITSPAEDGDGAYRCMMAAIKRAGISVGDIDYINAHGTSTPLGDEIELKAVERVVGNAAGGISMSSTNPASAICSAPPARSKRSSACLQCATRLCRRRSISTIRRSPPQSTLWRTKRKSVRSISRCRIHSDSAAPMPHLCSAA